MKGIIVYKSSSGSAEQYARWLAESTGFTCVEASKARRLADYDAVVIGCSIRALKPSLAGWIVRQWSKLKNKRVVLFTVAGAPKEDSKRTMWVDKALGSEIAGALPHFPLNGKMIVADLKPFDRWLMKMAVSMTAIKAPESAAKMAREYNGVKREDLAGLAALVKSWGVGAH